MIRLLFSLRYQTQIRHTRPELYSFLEDSILKIIAASGGTVRIERRYIAVSFNDKEICFWLDMLSALENMMKILGEATSELYGYIYLIGQDLDEGDLHLMHSFPSGGTGIWCDYSAQQALSPYAQFENNYEEVKGIPGGDGYNRIKTFKSFPGRETEKIFPYREKIRKILGQGSPKNAVLAGPRFIGKRDGLRFYCVNLLKGLPMLRIVFGIGGNSMGCFTDALTDEIRGFITPFATQGGMEELNRLGEAIFQERFRGQYSPYFVRRTRRFMELLLEFYEKALYANIKTAPVKPIIILENINFADAPSVELFTGLFQDKIKTNYLVYGSFSENVSPGNEGTNEGTNLDAWTRVFSRVIQVSLEDFFPQEAPEITRDLWELAYSFSLLRRYFPCSLFPHLFKEANINPLMVSRALDIFASQGIIDFREDPQPRIADFDRQAERILGERKSLIQAMVSGRILALVNRGVFRPCYNMLEALADIGGEGSDTLVLDSIAGDIMNNTYRAIEEAIQEKRFIQVVGSRRFTALLYIFTSLCALIHQGEDEIRRAFLKPVPDADATPVYKARILSNLAAFHLGVQDIPAAYESVKESMILSQNQREGRGLVQAYRLFSLVNIYKQRVGEAIDYSDFAIENAERAGFLDELAITAYYAAGIHLLFGNLSKAERLAQQADEAASITGRIEWADRSRFLLGRLRFETGRYKEARDIFAGLLEQDIPGASENREPVLRAWIYRSRVFLRQLPGSLSGTMTADARLFEIEAACLAGEYERTVRLADNFSTDLPDTRFIFIEQPDWWSGFAQCELLLSLPKDFFNRMLSTYRALALSKLRKPAASGNSTAGEMALDGMRRVIREEGFPHTDPNDAFYYYSYYCVLRETGAVEVDMDTAVSIAFKRLQSRASHIDDIEIKRAYLSQNYWNNALGQAARVHRLI
ncbi:MAG: tetratricopeptide repeat protein [Treponema sp.]|jgi:tetratricopeptide (TPR) repeat protein|nr:tetratricopeptide repeat protein [Treponema sp.]